MCVCVCGMIVDSICVRVCVAYVARVNETVKGCYALEVTVCLCVGTYASL